MGIVARTKSVCPVCLKALPAVKIIRGDRVYIEKSCPEHGDFSTLVWDGYPGFESWKRLKTPAFPKKPATGIDMGCPFDCGLCPQHRQHTCTALIEVTKRCNLKCEFCFASSANRSNDKDMGLEDIKFIYESILKASGRCNIQISGGEPTVRDDLADIVEMGKGMGFKLVQVNTNGIRIAQDEGYARGLAKAGLDSIFMQFDGTRDSVYRRLRGKELLQIKIDAIENCRKNGIGVVLVPTLVRGVNFDDIGGIIDFAAERIPTVRGVHFQPVSYFGRFRSQPRNEDRITIPQVIREIESQTGGRLRSESFKPPG